MHGAFRADSLSRLFFYSFFVSFSLVSETARCEIGHLQDRSSSQRGRKNFQKILFARVSRSEEFREASYKVLRTSM